MTCVMCVCASSQFASLDICHVKSVYQGQKTTTFLHLSEKKKTIGPEYSERSFSIVTSNRSLDIVAPSSTIAQVTLFFAF